MSVFSIKIVEKLVFQYGTAAHLALLTVAPLFLSACCGTVIHAITLVWLSVFGAMWILLNPSPQAGEWPRDARHRIGHELVQDPFLVFSVVVLILASTRAINSGIAVAYNATTGLWYLKGPAIALLPGSVAGQGVLPLAGYFGLLVVVLGVRHALGARARLAYLILSALLAAGAVVFWLFLGGRGVTVPRLGFSIEDPFSLSSLLGVYLIFAVVAWVESWSTGQLLSEILSAVAVTVLLTGLLLYASSPVVFLFGAFAVLSFAGGVGLFLIRRNLYLWLRTGVFLAIALAPVFALVFGIVTRASSLWPVFPEEFGALYGVASSVALDAVKNSAQLGVGVGAYPLAIGFFAKPEDWHVLSVLQSAAPNGWVHFIFERGFLGMAVLLFGFGLLVRDCLLRYIRAGSAWSLTLLHLLGPIVLLSVSAILFVDCSYVQLENLMPIGAALALTASVFPRLTETDYV